MAYRTILLELVDDPQNDPRIECGRRLAAQFEAELVGIHVSPPPFIPVGFGEGAVYVGPEIFEAQREANRLVRERVEAAFRRLCDPAKMAVRDIYEEGDPGTVIAEAARGADLTVVAQEGGSGIDSLAPQPIHHIILSAGGPVLMLPRTGLRERHRPPRGGRLERLARGGAGGQGRAAVPGRRRGGDPGRGGRGRRRQPGHDHGAAQAPRRAGRRPSRSTPGTAPAPRSWRRPRRRAPICW